MMMPYNPSLSGIEGWMAMNTSPVKKSMDLSNQFLVAMPGVIEGELAGAVIYLCEHNERGALGLVINRPTDLTVGTLFERIDLQQEIAADAAPDTPVYFGGPVQTERGFVLHAPPGDYSSTIRLNDEMALTTSRDVLQAVAEGHGPAQMLVTLGYAGWGAGQLEDELAHNAWITVNADPHIIFDVPPAERYHAALGLLGIDPIMLAGGVAGHA